MIFVAMLAREQGGFPVVRLDAVEVWQAMHDACPWPGCGQCADVDVAADLYAAAAVRAAECGVGVSTVLHAWSISGRDLSEA